MAEEVSHLKGDILKAVNKGRSKRPWFRSCAILLAVATVAVGGYVAWVVAATGIVAVPVLSGWVYAAPSPSRTVAPGLSLEALAKSGSFRGAVSDIPETTLTTMTRDALATSGQTWFDDHGAQAARLDSTRRIELFLPLRDNALKSAVVARLDVSDDQGTLVVTVIDAKIGSWDVPAWIVASVITPALAPAVASLNESLP